MVPGTIFLYGEKRCLAPFLRQELAVGEFVKEVGKADSGEG